jgi:hypothetical protein
MRFKLETSSVRTEASRRAPWGRSGVALLTLAVLLGGTLRLYDVGGPSFSDDEVFKVRAVEAYRNGQWTLTGDDEHPLLMKLLIFASYGFRELWNAHVAKDNKLWEIGLESATRGPNAIASAFLAVLLAFLARELFSRRVGLIAAFLWAVELNVIGYSRIAKEDTLIAFFLVLALYFVVRAKRTAESGDLARSRRNEVFAAMAIGGLFATKYFFHLAIPAVLFYLWSRLGGATAWHVSWKRWLALVGVAFLTFSALNPTVFHPENLGYIFDYIGHRYVYHHGYLFMGDLYMNNIFAGDDRVPWYYFFAYLGLKVPIPVLLAAVAGLGVALWKRREDGPRMIFVWLAVWLGFHAFFSGAKWGRFIVHLMPAVLLLAAVGLDAGARALARLFERHRARPIWRTSLAVGLAMAALAPSLYAALDLVPHYRMYLNSFGGPPRNLRAYFPHCDFYDVGLREAIQYVCARAEKNAQVRAEPEVAVAHYMKLCGRDDIKVTTMSRPGDHCEAGRACYHILQEGRMYFETRATFAELHARRPPDAIVRAGGVRVAEIYGPGALDGLALAISTPGDAQRLGALARAFGNALRRGGLPVGDAGVAFESEVRAEARGLTDEARGPKRVASLTSAFRFASDVVVEETGALPMDLASEAPKLKTQ